jgi:hypothetical protein
MYDASGPDATRVRRLSSACIYRFPAACVLFLSAHFEIVMENMGLPVKRL